MWVYICLLSAVLLIYCILYNITVYIYINIYTHRCKNINRNKHTIIQSSHPSPLGAYQTSESFMTSKLVYAYILFSMCFCIVYILTLCVCVIFGV